MALHIGVRGNHEEPTQTDTCSLRRGEGGSAGVYKPDGGKERIDADQRVCANRRSWSALPSSGERRRHCAKLSADELVNIWKDWKKRIFRNSAEHAGSRARLFHVRVGCETDLPQVKDVTC
jgi:hypothetical protein